jgi:hypothetical protein
MGFLGLVEFGVSHQQSEPIGVARNEVNRLFSLGTFEHVFLTRWNFARAVGFTYLRDVAPLVALMARDPVKEKWAQTLGKKPEQLNFGQSFIVTLGLLSASNAIGTYLQTRILNEQGAAMLLHAKYGPVLPPEVSPTSPRNFLKLYAARQIRIAGSLALFMEGLSLAQARLKSAQASVAQESQKK